MVSLVALMSSDSANWKGVATLINSAKWDSVFLVCCDLAYSSIDLPGVSKFKYDSNDVVGSIMNLSKVFREEVSDFEVCINLTSGSGVEHMALVSAVLKAGLGLRFVHSVNGEVLEFELLNEKFFSERGDF